MGPMSTTPDIRDRHIADLRDALQRASSLLAFSAGAEAREDPTHSGRLMDEAERMDEILKRTAPE